MKNSYQFFSPGDTRLGLMWTCITLYNRPQICFTPDLQPEWLLALVCIFVGCICITTTIILLASSHWDRNVVPYARWVGFTASKYKQDWNCVKSFNRCVVTKTAYWLLLCSCPSPIFPIIDLIHQPTSLQPKQRYFSLNV